MSAAGRPQPVYFVSPVVDLLAMGGLSLLCFPLLVFAPLSDTMVEWGVISLWWVVNWPHFSATSYRLYRSRDNLEQYPVTAYAIPVLVAVATAASFLSPASVAPSFIKLVVIWSIYHFGGQTLGLTLLYARRAGIAVGSLERHALQIFLFTTFMARVAWDETGTGVREYFGIQHARLGLPAIVGDGLFVVAVAAGAFFLVRLFASAARAKRDLPPIVLLPAITYFVWFVPGRRVAYFYAFVPLFHSIQYLLVAWAMQLKERMQTEQIPPSVGYVVRESLRWGAINVVGGALLFFALPRLCSLSGATNAFSFAVVASAVQLHHFFVDGVIWKLKNPNVTSPLLVGIDELVKPPAPSRGQPQPEAA